MRFRIGQTVMLVHRTDMEASVGSTAIIECIDEEFLYVKWTTPQTQSDGAYYPFHFKPNPVCGEQLEFSFMNEVI